MGLLAIGIIMFQIASAQENYKPGYIIKNNSDTIIGFVDNRDWSRNPDVVKFTTNIENYPTFFRPIDLIEFGVEDEIYVSGVVNVAMSPMQMGELEDNPQIQTKIERAFLQTIFKGEKSLYYYISALGVKNFYIKQDTAFDLLMYKKYLRKVPHDNKTFVMENKMYVGQLTLYFADCENINKKLENALYNKSSLIKAFQYYYECVSSDVYFQTKTRKLKFEFGVLAGPSITTLKFGSDAFPYLVNADYNSSINFTTGLFFDLILPVSQGKWSINNEILFSSYKVKGTYTEYVHEDYYSIRDSEIGHSYLKINTLVRFKYPVGSSFLFLNGGMSNGLSISETNNMRTESKFHSEEKLVEGLALDDVRKYEIGLIAGAGVKYNRFSLELRFEAGNGMSEYLALKSSAKRYTLLLGYKF